MMKFRRGTLPYCLDNNGLSTIIGGLVLILLNIVPFSLLEIQKTDSPGYFSEESSLAWEDLELQFLTTVVGPQLHFNDFHVINGTLLAQHASYLIHLSKTTGLFYPQHLGMSEEEANDLQCLFSGTITEILQDPSSNQDPKSGRVSFSSCHYEAGFVFAHFIREGLILLPNEQYYVKPADGNTKISKVVKRSVPSSQKLLVLHKAHRLAETIRLSPTPNPEILRVPPEELQKARAEAKKNQDSLDGEALAKVNSSASPASPSTNDPDIITNETSQNIKAFGELTALPDLAKSDGTSESLNDCNDPPCKSLPPVISSLSGNRRTPRRKQQRKGPSSSKRAVASTTPSKIRVVELAVFTDEKLYKTWQSRFPKDTTAKMNQYVLAVVNNMNTLYQQPTMTENISFRLVHLEVETVKPKNLKDHGSHATKYLKSFCAYAKEKNKFGSLWDHALLLTGHDLQEGGNSGFTYGSPFITTHEIGHSLGMEHDGSGSSMACDANSYLMSPTTGGGKTDWSSCSIQNMKNFLSRGYGGNSAPNCITQKSSKAGSAIKFNSHKLPGEQFDATVQCSAECNGCTPYSTNRAPYNNMCHLLFCKTTGRGYYTIWGSHPALEGTVCGQGKTCQLGKCK